MIEKERIIFMATREHFRKNNKTTWGKQELIKELDQIEEELLQ